MIALLGVAYFAEGLDIFLVGKIAPIMANSFAAPVESMTPVFMGHQAGLAIGAALGGTAADRLGRKTVLLAALFLAGLTTLAVPLARGLDELVAMRALAGLFLGAAAPCVLALVSSLAAPAARNMTLTAILASYSLGAASGSLIAMSLIDDFGWGIGFALAGGLLIAAMLALAVVLPEAAATARDVHASPRQILEGPLVGEGVSLAFAFAASMGLIALLAAWTPSLFAERANISVQQFAAVGVLAGPAAIIGMLGVGWLSDKLEWSRLCLLVFGTHAAALALLGVTEFGGATFAAAFAFSILAQASGQGLLNLAIAKVYPDETRATAFGVAGAIGRTAGIVAPWIGGVALASDWSLFAVFGLSALVPVIVGSVMLSLNLGKQRRL